MENGKYEHKDMTGTLWMDIQTKQGKDGTTYECYTGNALINGIDHWMNAYPKTLASGKQILSISFRPKQPKSGPMTQTDILPKQAPSLDQVPLDQIPF